MTIFLFEFSLFAAVLAGGPIQEAPRNEFEAIVLQQEADANARMTALVKRRLADRPALRHALAKAGFVPGKYASPGCEAFAYTRKSTKNARTLTSSIIICGDKVLALVGYAFFPVSAPTTPDAPTTPLPPGYPR